MPKLAYDERQYYADVYPTKARVTEISTFNPKRLPQRKVSKKKFGFKKLISLAFYILVAIFILPLGFNRVTQSIIHGSQYPSIKTNLHKLRFPTTDYISNDLFLNQRFLTPAKIRKPQMSVMAETYENTDLENQIKNLMSQYPSIKPSVYVWQYGTEKFININSDKIYSAASIIKIPVLIQLFRSIEKEQFSLNDEMTLTDYYKAEGSGSLQYKSDNTQWSINSLARIMITESDNSATNMLMSKMGSMTDVNAAIRQWGLKNTYVQTWLPDITGNNYTTAHDIAVMLYNIANNDKFLNTSSRQKIFDYMEHVHNNRLIQAGLPQNAVFMHKTGDIGKMLGDAGIVFAPNGTKYIVVILANRPHNSIHGKDFIVKASQIIYNNMVR